MFTKDCDFTYLCHNILLATWHHNQEEAWCHLLSFVHQHCYDHVQLRDLSGYSGRIAALQLNSGRSVTYSGHSRAVILLLSTTPGLCSIRSLPHLTVYPALTWVLRELDISYTL